MYNGVAMRRLFLATADTTPAPAEGLLTEDEARDQLSTAEELLYVGGHPYPALIAAGVALIATLRLRAALRGADPDATSLDLLAAETSIGDNERRLLERALAATARLAQGFAPEIDGDETAHRVQRIADSVTDLLEECAGAKAPEQDGDARPSP
jgi:hypothetical protein